MFPYSIFSIGFLIVNEREEILFIILHRLVIEWHNYKNFIIFFRKKMGFVVIHLAIEVLGYLAVNMNNAETRFSLIIKKSKGNFNFI